MPRTDLIQAKARAQDLLEKVRQLEVTYQGVVVGTLTISLGIACFPEQGETAAALIEAADQALYQAKRNGRNCIVCSEVAAVEAG